MVNDGAEVAVVLDVGGPCALPFRPSEPPYTVVTTRPTPSATTTVAAAVTTPGNVAKRVLPRPGASPTDDGASALRPLRIQSAWPELSLPPSPLLLDIAYPPRARIMMRMSRATWAVSTSTAAR